MFGVQLQVSTFLNRRKEFGKGILDEVLYVVLQSVVINRDKLIRYRIVEKLLNTSYTR